MTLSRVDSVLAMALEDRRLLEHPFYRRWEAGGLSMPELGSYAAQYRHFEAYLPGFLQALADRLDSGPARDLVNANLADELGDPVSHVERFEDFARSVGAASEPLSPATTALLDAYDSLLEEGPAPALAGFLAYEAQSAEIAASKAAGLRRHYGLDRESTAFWDHHARVDQSHGEWARQALASLAEGSPAVASGMRRAADAWWSFLDEREAAATLVG